MPACHWIHFLQMATEKMARAHAMDPNSNEQPARTHGGFFLLIRTGLANERWQGRLGYAGQSKQYKAILKRLRPLAQQTENMAPALAEDRPNPEYPWESPQAKVTAPADYGFPNFTAAGSALPQLLNMVQKILNAEP